MKSEDEKTRSTLNIQSEQVCEVRRITWTGIGVNILLSAVKFAGGWLGNSQAVIADAVHSVSDLGTDIAILVGVKYWEAPADSHHPYGHRKVEMLVTIGIGLSLVGVAVGLIYDSLSTLSESHSANPGWIALVATVLSILTKEILYRWTVKAGQRIRSSAVIANAWHHRSDAMSSVPAAIAVLIATFYPEWGFADHVGAVVVSLMILQAAYRILRGPVQKLVDQSAPEEIRSVIRAQAKCIPGVASIHRLRTRYIGCDCLQVDLHVLVDGELTVRQGHEISEQVQNSLRDIEGVMDVVVHVEPDDPEQRRNEAEKA